MSRGDEVDSMKNDLEIGREFGPSWYGFGRFNRLGRGRDRLMNDWLLRQYDALSKDERKEMIQEEIEDLQRELEELEEKLRGI